MRVKVYMKWNKNNITCICKADKKKCNCNSCEKDTVEYRQYKGIDECFKNSEKRR